MTWGQIAILASYAAACALWLVVRVGRARRHQREYLASVLRRLGDSLQEATISFSAETGILSGRRSGRAMAVALHHIKDFWEPQIAVECRAAIFFSLGPIDGPESYAAQLHDPDVREAVRRFIERHRVRLVAIDPVPSADGMRLKVSFEWYRTRRPPPVDIVAIVDEVFALASMLEERFGADAS